MNILNIHSYKGSSKNSAYTALHDIVCKDIISPAIDYDAESPENILGKLRYIIADKRINLIVGTSLGRYFAAALSTKTNLPVMLVNPCMLPFLRLLIIGFNGDMKPLVAMFGILAKLDRSNVSCIVGEDDEVIDTHDFTERLLNNARFRMIPGGKHLGSTLPLKEYFSKMLHYYTDVLPLREDAECIPPEIFEKMVKME